MNKSINILLVLIFSLMHAIAGYANSHVNSVNAHLYTEVCAEDTLLSGKTGDTYQEFILARKGSEENAPCLYAKDVNWTEDKLDVYFANSGWRSSYNSPSLSALENLRKVLLETLNDEKDGLHTRLFNFPELKTMRVHLENPENNRNTNIFNIIIDSGLGKHTYVVEYTEYGKLLAEKAKINDKKRSAAIQKRKEIQMQRQEAARRVDEKRAAKFAKNGFPYKTKLFWGKYSYTEKTLRPIYEGQFEKAESREIVRLMLISYGNTMNLSCLNLLPENKEIIEYEYSSQSEEYSGVGYPGQGLFIDHYNSAPAAAKGYFSADPRFVETYHKIDEEHRIEFMKKMSGTDLNPVSYINRAMEVNSFFRELKCDKKDMWVIGENLLRYFNDEPSLQQEKGL